MNVVLLSPRSLLGAAVGLVVVTRVAFIYSLVRFTRAESRESRVYFGCVVAMFGALMTGSLFGCLAIRGGLPQSSPPVYLSIVGTLGLAAVVLLAVSERLRRGRTGTESHLRP